MCAHVNRPATHAPTATSNVNRSDLTGDHVRAHTFSFSMGQTSESDIPFDGFSAIWWPLCRHTGVRVRSDHRTRSDKGLKSCSVSGHIFSANIAVSWLGRGGIGLLNRQRLVSGSDNCQQHHKNPNTSNNEVRFLFVSPMLCVVVPQTSTLNFSNVCASEYIVWNVEQNIS